MDRWVVQQRKLWGDYGKVLVSGFAKRSDAGELLIERAGPFVPPIFFPLVVPKRFPVVTDRFREQLLEEFPFLQFRSVRKDRIVHLNWHDWPRDAEKPSRLPRDAEPENYLEGQPHDPAAAAALGALWEITGPVCEGRLSKVKDPRGGYLDEFTGNVSDNNDIIIRLSQHLLVADGVKDWLSENAGEWVMFCPIKK